MVMYLIDWNIAGLVVESMGVIMASSGKALCLCIQSTFHSALVFTPGRAALHSSGVTDAAE